MPLCQHYGIIFFLPNVIVNTITVKAIDGRDGDTSMKGEILYEGDSVNDLWPRHCRALEEHETALEVLNAFVEALLAVPERTTSLRGCCGAHWRCRHDLLGLAPYDVICGVRLTVVLSREK